MTKLRAFSLPLFLGLFVLLSCGCETDIVTGEPVSGDSTVITTVEPVDEPPTNTFSSQQLRALELVNDIRAEGCRCGTEQMPPVAPLALAPALNRAAYAHSTDMARNNKMQHQGSDGSNVGQRVSSTGYEWRAVAENVAWNQPDVAAVVTAWKGSPGHCRNLMSSTYTEMGFAEQDRYWTQVFARQR
ncbi:hypothetical protein A3850_007480 [Lewinella sp. 4G2]|nr:hypothetical protein A3850_007480 [Lewinella sp. 4G2]